MRITKQSIVGDIVAQNYDIVPIFNKYGVDFCCGGSLSIEASCDKESIESESAESLVNELNAFMCKAESPADLPRFNEWPLDDLAEHIERKHHSYVEEKIPLIKDLLLKIESVHGDDHPELAEIRKIFFDATGELVMHMKKEELILFPYIKKMAKAKREGTSLATPSFITIKNPISQMDAEHEFEGEAFKRIAGLSSQYALPSDGCFSYKMTFDMLKEFEEDLHLHIHKENNILFKRAIQMEEELKAA